MVPRIPRLMNRLIPGRSGVVNSVGGGRDGRAEGPGEEGAVVMTMVGSAGIGSVEPFIIDDAPLTIAAVAAAIAADTEPARFRFRTSSALFIFFNDLTGSEV